MALLWIDGFEGYGPPQISSAITSLLQQRRYGVQDDRWYVGVGRVGGYCCYHFTTGATSAITTPALTIDPTLTIGCALSWQVVEAITTIELFDGATKGINITIHPHNYPSIITLSLGDTTLATYSSSTLLLDTWYYLEMKVFCHPTSGTVEVRIDGKTIILLAGINTQAGANTYHDKVRISLYLKQFLDDFYICDATGSGVNGFQGICRIIGLFPSADTEIVDWTPNSGTTHYNRVDENPADGNTTYISSSTQTDTDLFTYPSLINYDGNGEILGIQLNTEASLSAGDSIILESPIVSNGATDLGPDYTLTSSSYYEYQHISEFDPNTNQPWTAAGLNAAQIGVRVM
jgi:hypothetical protein